MTGAAVTVAAVSGLLGVILSQPGDRHPVGHLTAEGTSPPSSIGVSPGSKGATRSQGSRGGSNAKARTVGSVESFGGAGSSVVVTPNGTIIVGSGPLSGSSYGQGSVPAYSFPSVPPGQPPEGTTTTTTTTPTVPSHPGVLLTGNGTTEDAYGPAQAWWVGPGAYDPGPSAHTRSFGFNGHNGLTDPGIPQLGSANFAVNFWLYSPQQRDANTVDVLGYRTGCQPGTSGTFFDVRIGGLAGPGHLEVEFDTKDSPIDLHSTTRVNDGRWHSISITRSGSDLTLKVDGQSQGLHGSSHELGNRSVTNYATWQFANGDPCVQTGGTAPLIGAMADIYIGPLPGVP